MSKEYEESSGSTTELAADREAAPYESSSLLSWKVMLSYLVGERRQRVAIGSSYVPCGECTGGLIYHKKVGVLFVFRILFLLFVRELNENTISNQNPLLQDEFKK